MENRVRKLLPFLESRPENNAVLRDDRSAVGYGRWSRTNATPPPPPLRPQVPERELLIVPKHVLNLLQHGRGEGVARFSRGTGELEVVDEKGGVLW